MTTTAPPLLAVAHGTRDQAGQATVRALVDAVAANRPGTDVRLAWVDDVSPSPAVALAGLAGAGEVVVLPLLLTAATHAKTDVPGSVQAARLAHPGLVLRYGAPLGGHPLVVQALLRRLTEAGVETSGEQAAATAVVLAAAGSVDPDANAEVARIARLLLEGRDLATVEVAFASATRPSPQQVGERLGRLGHTRVALLPFMLAPGFFATKAARELRAGLPKGVELVLAEPVGAAPELAQLLWHRYDEALVGQVRMACDSCLYRTPYPGLGDRVGQPQSPHSHPDDR